MSYKSVENILKTIIDTKNKNRKLFVHSDVEPGDGTVPTSIAADPMDRDTAKAQCVGCHAPGERLYILPDTAGVSGDQETLLGTKVLGPGLFLLYIKQRHK